jgi:hypothetical protein
MFRQALEGVLGLRLVKGEPAAAADAAAGEPGLVAVTRDVGRSPFPGPAALRPPARQVVSEQSADV